MSRGINVVFLDSQSIRRRHSSFLDLYRFSLGKSPVLILIDDIDLFFSDRDFSEGHNILGDMLQALDGVHASNGAIVLATTNHFAALDAALTRPGRFDLHIHIDPPKDEKFIIELLARQMFGTVELDSVTLQRLVGRTPAEIVEYCNRYKIVLISSGKKFVWDRDLFARMVDEVQGEREKGV